MPRFPHQLAVNKQPLHGVPIEPTHSIEDAMFRTRAMAPEVRPPPIKFTMYRPWSIVGGESCSTRNSATNTYFESVFNH